MRARLLNPWLLAAASPIALAAWWNASLDDAVLLLVPPAAAAAIAWFGAAATRRSAVLRGAVTFGWWPAAAVLVAWALVAFDGGRFLRDVWTGHQGIFLVGGAVAPAFGAVVGSVVGLAAQSYVHRDPRDAGRLVAAAVALAPTAGWASEAWQADLTAHTAIALASTVALGTAMRATRERQGAPPPFAHAPA